MRVREKKFVDPLQLLDPHNENTRDKKPIKKGFFKTQICFFFIAFSECFGLGVIYFCKIFYWIMTVHMELNSKI